MSPAPTSRSLRILNRDKLVQYLATSRTTLTGR
jgi:hypothetical protein